MGPAQGSRVVSLPLHAAVFHERVGNLTRSIHRLRIGLISQVGQIGHHFILYSFNVLTVVNH